MPIQYAKDAPENANQVIEEYLAQRMASDVPSPLKAVAAEATPVTQGYRVWQADVRALAEGKLLSASTPGNWRYQIAEDDQASTEGDLVDDAKGLRVVALHEGPRAGGTAAGLEAAQNLDAVQSNDYEIRFLECPGLFLAALWLHGEGDDIFIPVEPDRTELENYGAYTEAQVIEVLKTRAAEVLAAQEAAPGPSGG